MIKPSICAILISGTILTGAIVNADSGSAPVIPSNPTTQTVETKAVTPATTAPTPATAVAAEPPTENQKIVYVYTTQPPPANATVATQPPTAAAPPQAPVKKDYSFNGNPALCFGRGIANIATCWLEIPRCIIYDNDEIPVIGTIVGIPEGAGYTVARALAGTADIVSFGLDMGTFYGKYMPNFVWDANWAPSKK